MTSLGDLGHTDVLETRGYSLPVQSFADPPTDAEVADAMQIARDAGWVTAIAGEQEWSLLDREWLGGPRWIRFQGPTITAEDLLN